MDCYLARSSALLSTYIVLFAISALFHYTTHFLFPQQPIGKVKIDHVVDFAYIPRFKGEQSFLRFDVQGDFTSAFQWNTHQLFVYVFVRYTTDEYKVNEVIVWDSIITDEDLAKFNYKNIFSKYPLKSLGHQLKGTPVEIVLAYRYMPIVGLMKERIVASSSFTFPKRYFYASLEDQHDARN